MPALPNIAVLVYEPPAITVVTDDLRIVVAVTEPDLAVVVVPGLPGQDGTGTGGSDLDTAAIPATENIASLSLVTINGKTADSSNLTHFNRVVGITMDAVLNTFLATVIVEGEVTDLSWSWTAGQKLFLNGTTLSTTPVTTGFSQLIGLTRNSNTIFIRLEVPIKL